MGNGKFSAPKKGNDQKSKSALYPRKNKNGTLIFYIFYCFLILALLVAFSFTIDPLRNWLIRFEASQPKQKCEEVFQQLFSDPDWEQIYTLAGVQDTQYEGKEAYAAYMEALVGDDALTYLETSAGLSGNRKYIVKHKDTKIATFTLTGGAASEVSIPEWKQGPVEVFFTRTKGITVTKLPEQTVYVNGIALDDSFTIRTVSTVAENYLPEGVHGYRLEQQAISGFLVEPKVTVKDPLGNDVPVTYDSETGIYSTLVEASSVIPDDLRQTALTATEIYAKYMIRAVKLPQLSNYFDSSSEIYQTISKDESIVQSYAKYELTGHDVSDYYRYSDNLFSVHVNLLLKLTRNNGTIKEFDIDSTFFFTADDQGTWLVTNMTNVDIQQVIEKVLLTFKDGDTVLDRQFITLGSLQITTPAVTVPEGKTFSGWVKETVDENGKTTLTVVFTPDEKNLVYLSEDTKVEPMTLYTLFESKGSGS